MMMLLSKIATFLGVSDLMTKVIAIAVVFALTASAIAFYNHRQREIGRDEIRQQNDKANIEQLKERNETDAEIKNASERSKCQLIGGVFVNGTCQ